jgi:hypothetical protein
VRGHAVGRREIWIELDRPIEETQRLAVAFPGPLIIARYAAEIMIIGVEALGRLALGTRDLSLLQLGPDHPHDARGDFILEIEDVVERAIEAVGSRSDGILCDLV